MMNMRYTFEEVKNLFDNYNIKKQENGNFYVTDRDTNTSYTDDKLVDYVKFAYTWIRACQYNRKRATFDLSVITFDDYYNAFNNHTEKLYEALMEICRNYLKENRTMIEEEQLIEKLEYLNYIHTNDIIKGLYSNERFFKIFEDWVKYSLES